MKWFYLNPLLLAFYALVTLVAACTIPDLDEKNTNYTATEEGRQLALKLMGDWDLETLSYTTDCPQELAYNPMNGETRWLADEHRVDIEWLTEEMHFMEFWATGSRTLQATRTIEGLGCKATAETVITIGTLRNNLIEAQFWELYTHNKAEVCEIMAEEYDFPDRCHVVAQWLGWR